MTITLSHVFTEARSQNGYLDQPVSDQQLRELYEWVKFGPTAVNSGPARFLFVRTPEAKEKLAACMSPGNQAKVRQAPVSVVIGMDLDFPQTLPRLFPHVDAKAWYQGQEALVHETAFRNSSLQGGYLILAARALGLGCGPMSGFDAAQVDTAFWSGSRVRTNFICTLGHGDPAKLFPRHPRLAFDEACQLA